MARDFTSNDAKQLIVQLNALQNMQREIVNLPEQYRQDAQSQTRQMIGYRAFDNFVRDELNRGTDAPESLRGAERIINDISMWMKLSPIAQQISTTAQKNDNMINSMRQSLSAGSSGLRWMFSSSKTKEETVQAYRAAEGFLRSIEAKNISALYAQTTQIKNLPANAAWQEFQNNRTAFGEAFAHMAPELMQGNLVHKLSTAIEGHRSLLQPFLSAEQAIEQSKENIRNAANRVAARDIMSILKGVPVEELNRGKGGIRVKTLRDCGYETLADIYAAAPSKLEAVKGISAEGAREIKTKLNEYLYESANTVKIKLSADDKNPDSTALVQEISAYILRKDSLRDYYKLQETFKPKTDAAENSLINVGNGVRWLFYNSNQKAEVTQAYQYLVRLQKSDYAANLKQLSNNIRGNFQVSTNEAWARFESDTVRFWNVLEEVCPERVGSSGSVYGLPEDLAHEIQQQPLNLEGLRCELRRYQEWGVKYAIHQQRVLLGDEMGLGKTVQAIAAMVSLRNEGATHFVVVCPASVLSNWCREINKHSDLSVIMVHGSSRSASVSKWIEEGGVAVTTYETTGAIELDDNFKYNYMVVDEAHYIKNRDAQRTVNVRKLCQKAEKILFMTGTAIENKVDEMISLIEVLNPDVATQIKRMAFMSSAPQFREAVAPVYYRRKREDVLTELPDKTETEEWCTLSGEEVQCYEDAVLSKNFAGARRVSWNVDDVSLSSKANRMKELLAEAEAEGRKVIVFSFFLDTIEKVRGMLGDKCVGPINGSVPPQRRQEMVDEFDKAQPGAVLAAQIQSGGTGLNIQSASVIILCEPQFKPSIENQAISRAYRMGQARNVLVYRLLCEDTVDEKIMEMLAEKQAVFDAFADKSTVAEETLELDEKSFGDIMESEIKRIQESRAANQNEENK
ncbi:SNF2-related protein [Ruminococcus sp. JL13D9]|uniref:SNF2-related protein n=1 Tax=Ruminococcus sp. JL13D9 TaxID=3233381 RepID=UPI00389B0847